MQTVVIKNKSYPIVFGLYFIRQYGEPRGFTTLGSLGDLLGDISFTDLPRICKLGIDNAALIQPLKNRPTMEAIEAEMNINLGLAMSVVNLLNQTFMDTFGEKAIETGKESVEAEEPESESVKN